MSTDQSNSYILISGKGRSGSNRLLDILDTSRVTVCRSEVNEIRGSSFFGIGAELFADDLGPDQLCSLKKALPEAVKRRSSRDRLDQNDKRYLTISGRAGLRLLAKARLRHILNATGMLAGRNEWSLPSRFLKTGALPDARLVLKLNSTPSWTAALARTDEDCRIVHNIRDPAEYLQSWYNRFISRGIGTSSFEQKFQDVPRILTHFGRSNSDDLAAPTEENLIEVELWRWRYINEALRSLAVYRDRYLLLTYSEIESDLPGSARRLFEFSNLQFGSAEQARIGSLKNVLFQKPHKFNLDRALCDRLISRVLEDSPLRSLPYEPVLSSTG